MSETLMVFAALGARRADLRLDQRPKMPWCHVAVAATSECAAERAFEAARIELLSSPRIDDRVRLPHAADGIVYYGERESGPYRQVPPLKVFTGVGDPRADLELQPGNAACRYAVLAPTEQAAHEAFRAARVPITSDLRVDPAAELPKDAAPGVAYYTEDTIKWRSEYRPVHRRGPRWSKRPGWLNQGPPDRIESEARR